MLSKWVTDLERFFQRYQYIEEKDTIDRTPHSPHHATMNTARSFSSMQLLRGSVSHPVRCHSLLVQSVPNQPRQLKEDTLTGQAPACSPPQSSPYFLPELQNRWPALKVKVIMKQCVVDSAMVENLQIDTHVTSNSSIAHEECAADTVSSTGPELEREEDYTATSSVEQSAVSDAKHSEFNDLGTTQSRVSVSPALSSSSFSKKATTAERINVNSEPDSALQLDDKESSSEEVLTKLNQFSDVQQVPSVFVSSQKGAVLFAAALCFASIVCICIVCCR